MNNYRKHAACVMLALAVLWCLPSPALATKKTWDNSTGDGKASTQANWSVESALAATDTLYFNSTGNTDCTFDANFKVRAIFKAASYSATHYWGSTADTVIDIYVDSSSDTTYWQTSSFTNAGSCLRVNNVFVVGTSVHTQYNGTGTVTLSGWLSYDVQRSNTNGMTKILDSTYIANDLDFDDGGFDFNGKSLAVGGDFLFDADTCRGSTANSRLWVQGASGQAHFGSTIAVAQMTGLDAQFQGTTGMVWDDDKGINSVKSWTLGANAVLTSSGSATTTLQTATASPCLILGNGSSLTTAAGTTLSGAASSTTLLSLPASYTWANNGTLTLRGAIANAVVSISGFTIGSGSGSVALANVSPTFTVTLNQTGDIAVPAAMFIRSTNTGTLIYGDGGHGLTAASLDWGAQNASGAFTATASGAKTISGAVGGTAGYGNGTVSITKSGAWSVGGNYTALSNATYTVTGSTYTQTGAGTLTSNGKTWADTIILNPGAGNRDSLADNLTTGTLKHLSGIFKHGAKKITLTGSYISRGDSVMARTALCTLSVGGDSVVTKATRTLLDSLVILTTKDGAVCDVGGKSWFKFLPSGTANLLTGGTFVNIQMPVAGGDSLVFPGSTKWVFTNLIAANINGADAAHPNSLICATVGQRDTLDIPQTTASPLVPSYTKWQGQTVVAGDSIWLGNGTNINLGYTR